MVLSPDLTQLAYSEENVKPSAGLAPRASYDAALYLDTAGSPKGVLVIKMVLQFRFDDGESQQAATKGQTLTWTDDEKQRFASAFRAACYSIWNNKFRISTTSNTANVNDIGVEIDIQNIVDKFTINNHWRLHIKKVDTWRQSSVNDWTGQTDFDSLDTQGANKGASMEQRGAVHEFGHMLGHRDEYTDSSGNPVGTPSWTTDKDSVMNGGEVVRERHYAMFASWITEQFATAAHLAGETIQFKVSGAWDISNSHL